METYQGIQGLALSTSGFINPTEAYKIADQYGRANGKKIGVEVYPYRSRSLDKPINFVLDLIGATANFRPNFDLTRLDSLTQGFPDAFTSHFHLPFGYDQSEINEQAWRPTRTSLNTRPIPGMNNIFHGFFAAYFDQQCKRRALEMARKRGIGINAHANVVQRHIMAGTLNELTDGVPFVVVENSPTDFPYNKIGDIPLLTDPIEVVEKIVRPNPKLGLLLGTEHVTDIFRALRNPGVRQSTRFIHLAGPNHEPMDRKNGYFQALIDEIANTTFAQPVTAVLDYSPIALLKMSYDEKYDLIADHFDWISQT